LSDVIRELADWHHQYYDELDDPESFAVPETQSQRLNLGFESD
jgi:hypothetical protein